MRAFPAPGDGMYRVILLQLICAALGTACGGLVFGMPGAIGALIGGAAYWVPNALFAWVLGRERSWSHAAQGLFLFVGEFAKIFLVILILAAVALLDSGVNWGAVVIGLIITLQANFLVFLVKP